MSFRSIDALTAPESSINSLKAIFFVTAWPVRRRNSTTCSSSTTFSTCPSNCGFCRYILRISSGFSYGRRVRRPCALTRSRSTSILLSCNHLLQQQAQPHPRFCAGSQKSVFRRRLRVVLQYPCAPWPRLLHGVRLLLDQRRPAPRSDSAPAYASITWRLIVRLQFARLRLALHVLAMSARKSPDSPLSMP